MDDHVSLGSPGPEASRLAIDSISLRSLEIMYYLDFTSKDLSADIMAM